MSRYSLAARVWMGFVVALAVLVVLQDGAAWGVTRTALLSFAFLGVCAAIANAFPIRSVFGAATVRMTFVFMMAGALVLPAGWLPFLPMVAITPDAWRHRRNPGVAIRWCFNVAQFVLGMKAVQAWLAWSGALQMDTLLHFAGLLGACLLFTGLRAGLIGITIALNTRIPLSRADTFTLPFLLSDLQTAVLGVILGGLWLVKPALLGLVLPFVALVYRLTQEAHMAHLSQVDPKTGLHNYRYFERMLEEEMARSRKTGRPLSVLFADLDLLREINNRYGHLAGDRVLQDVAALLSSNKRPGDLVARFGGEEFVVLLPATDAEEATYRAERLRKAVADHAFAVDGGHAIRCTISIGVATCPEDAKTISELVERADQAVYRAKQTRNSVASARKLPPVPRVSQQAGPAADRPAQAAPAAARPKPSPWGRVLLWSTVAAGAAAILFSLWQVYLQGQWLTLLVFACIGVVAEMFKVRVYEANRETISLSLGVGATMAAVTAYPPLAPLTSLASAAFHILTSRNRQWDKMLFNLTNPALAAAVAVAVNTWLLPAEARFDVWHFGAAAVAVLVNHLVNFGLVSLMIALHSGKRVGEVARKAGWQGPIKHMIAMTGAFIGGAYTQIGWIGTIMFIVPLFILRYTLERSAQSSEQAISTLQSAKNEVEQAHREKEETLEKLIGTLSAIIDARDNSVYGHSRQVARYAVAIGREMGMGERELSVLHSAALLHDLGKVGIPEAILHKPARLTPEEYEVIKEHAGLGEHILGETGSLSEVGRMVGEHHERFDGNGYPRGKRREEITLGGRIICVADTLDSIISDRPYSKAKPLPAALAELDRCAGGQFDPDVVQALHRVVAAMGPEFFVNSAVTNIPKEQVPVPALSAGQVS